MMTSDKILLGGLTSVALLGCAAWYAVESMPAPKPTPYVPCESVEPAPGDIVAEIESKMPGLLDDMAELRRRQDALQDTIDRLGRGTVTHRQWAAQYGSEQAK